MAIDALNAGAREAFPGIGHPTDISALVQPKALHLRARAGRKRPAGHLARPLNDGRLLDATKNFFRFHRIHQAELPEQRPEAGPWQERRGGGGKSSEHDHYFPSRRDRFAGMFLESRMSFLVSDLDSNRAASWRSDVEIWGQRSPLRALRVRDARANSLTGALVPAHDLGGRCAKARVRRFAQIPGGSLRRPGRRSPGSPFSKPKFARQHRAAHSLPFRTLEPPLRTATYPMRFISDPGPTARRQPWGCFPRTSRISRISTSTA
jgi:hypothetical protein